MPLPTPSGTEDSKSFINRCMGDPKMNSEYSDRSQRFAVCMSQWNTSKKDALIADVGVFNFDRAEIENTHDDSFYIGDSTVSVNTTGVAHARSLIKSGNVDHGSVWSFSSADGNAILGSDENWSEYSKWFLAIDTSVPEKTKGHYKYPFGKNGKVFRNALWHAEQRASAQGASSIQSAAKSLFDLTSNKKDNQDSYHFDRVDGPGWMIRKFVKTDEGYLRGRAIITNIGVFPYNHDGKTIYELRLPEEVFSPDSLETLKLIPVTNNHPKVKVNADNAKEFQVGYTGDDPSSIDGQNKDAKSKSDNIHLANDLVITTSDAVKDVESGKRALSAAYTCDLEPAAVGARWCGIPYDYIQRNIRYNHVAIVDKARAGDAAKIRFDSADAKEIYFREEVRMDLTKLNLDGTEYEVQPAVAEALQKAQKDAEKFKADAETANTTNRGLRDQISRIEGERDSLKDTKLALETKIQELEKTDSTDYDKKVFEAAKELNRVRGIATKLKVEVKDEMGIEELKKASILKYNPDAKLDEKDGVYISARFDALEDFLRDKSVAAVRTVRNDATPEHVQADANDSASARQKMIERMKKDSAEQKSA